MELIDIQRKDTAIRNTHPTISVIYQHDWRCLDKDKNEVEFDNDLVEVEITRLEKEYSDNEYARNRASAYPSTGDQLDYIFHNGVAKWKTDIIEPVKAKYPKPS